jgi:hypothetical protein
MDSFRRSHRWNRRSAGMTESNHLALKVFVERAIRPVLAEASSKLRMREELFAHACDVYEAELKHAPSPQAALERTFARLGDPAALTKDYQSAVSRLERASTWLGNRFERRAGESRVHFALRITIDQAIVVGLLLGHTLLIRIDQVIDGTNDGQVLLRMSIGIWAVYVVNSLVLSILACTMRDLFVTESRLADRAIRLLPLLAAVSLMMLFSGWSLTYIATSDPVAAWRVLWFWIPMMILAPPGCMIAAWLAAREYCRSRDWITLKLAD